MNTFTAQILTPEGSLFSGNVTGVRVPGTLGSFEVKALHADIISTLEVGRILVRGPGGEESHFAVTGGFVEVHDNSLILLAEAAEKVGEIDVDRARAAKVRAVERLESDDPEIDKGRARKALERAENRLSLAADITSAAKS